MSRISRENLGKVWRGIKGGIVQIGDTNLFLISAGVGFFGMLSLFPGLAALIAVMSLIANPAVVMTQLQEMRGLLPRDVYEIFNNQILSLVSTSPDTLGWASAISIIAAMWSARAGVAAMMLGLNAVYGEKNRTTTSHYLRAILLTLALVAVGVVSLLTLVVAPVVLSFFPLGWAGTLLAETVRWGIAVVVLLAGVSVLYRFGPNRENKATRRVVRPGAVVAVLAWAAVSVAFSFYVANFGNYNQIYGSIGAVIAMLVWLWISSFLILLGAVVNAQVEKVIYGADVPEAVSPFEPQSPPPEELADETPGTALP